ncbi:hypothetical protein GH733_004134 [Mirounga leonina]|nr:hypothetical protein GH733_004134 [Mirounga leonina]
MKCSPAFMTMVLLMLGQTHGDSVTQTEGQVTLLEEASLTINCTYSTTGYPTLFWYVQYPGEGLHLLLSSSGDQEKKSKKGFESTFDSKSKSFHLQKGSVQASDSAVYYCALSDTSMAGELMGNFSSKRGFIRERREGRKGRGTHEPEQGKERPGTSALLSFLG